MNQFSRMAVHTKSTFGKDGHVCITHTLLGISNDGSIFNVLSDSWTVNTKRRKATRELVLDSKPIGRTSPLVEHAGGDGRPTAAIEPSV
jgi:hypothetical protein